MAIVSALYLVLLPAYIIRALFYNFLVRPNKHKAWENQFLCQRCGTAVDSLALLRPLLRRRPDGPTCRDSPPSGLRPWACGLHFATLYSPAVCCAKMCSWQTYVRSSTFSVRLKPGTKKRLARLAQASGRSSNFLISDAIDSYVADQERLLAEVRQSDRQVKTGHYIRHEDMKAWLLSWGTNRELPLPKCACGRNHDDETLCR